MTTEEFLLSKELSPADLGNLKLWDDLIFYVSEFVKIKCKEQRELCFEYAETLEYETDMGEITSCIQKDSIINAPEPELLCKISLYHII